VAYVSVSTLAVFFPLSTLKFVVGEMSGEEWVAVVVKTKGQSEGKVKVVVW
jgi:hypothetical protein